MHHKMTKAGSRMTALAAVMVMAALLAGGCGGSSDDTCLRNPLACGSVGATVTGNAYVMTSALPRSAGATVDTSYIHSAPLAGAAIHLATMDRNGAITSLGLNTATADSSGAFSLPNVPEGQNLIIVAASGSIRLWNTVTITKAQTATTVSSGDMDIASTLAVEAMSAFLESDTILTGASQIPADNVVTLKDKVLDNTLSAVLAAPATTISSFSSDSSLAMLFQAMREAYPVIDIVTNALADTRPTATSAPRYVRFLPENDATDVNYNAPSFCIVFSKSMSPDNPPSPINIVITKPSTGASLTINSSNYDDYGAFLWKTTVYANDTLCYNLKSNAELTNEHLFTLERATTYTLQDYTVPTNLVSADATPLAFTPNINEIPTPISFTTKN